MFRRIVSISIILLLTACANTQTLVLENNKTNQFAGKTITTTQYGQPAFMAQTKKNAIFGALVTLPPFELGAKILNDNQIKDPAIYMGEILVDDFASEFSAIPIEKPDTFVKKIKLDSVLEQYSDVDFVLDVRTSFWALSYFPANWGKYTVYYSVRLRLIDVKNKAVIAESGCKGDNLPPAESPNYAQMLADKAFLIRKQSNVAANKCINEFRSTILNLPEKPLEVIQLKKTPVIISQDNTLSTAIDGTVVTSKYPDVYAKLTAESSITMREAAIKIGQEKLYNDEAIFLATIQILEKEISNNIPEKIRNDGLAWCAINLGRAGDKRAIPVLEKVKNSDLPRKIRSHAIASLKKLSTN